MQPVRDVVRTALKQGLDARFYGVEEPWTTWGNKGGRQLATHRIEPLLAGSVAFEQIVAEDIVGMMVTYSKASINYSG